MTVLWIEHSQPVLLLLSTLMSTTLSPTVVTLLAPQTQESVLESTTTLPCASNAFLECITTLKPEAANVKLATTQSVKL